MSNLPLRSPLGSKFRYLIPIPPFQTSSGYMFGKSSHCGRKIFIQSSSRYTLTEFIGSFKGGVGRSLA